MFDIVVIGAGTAGMTAAIYARRAGKRVLVLEASSYGGQIINTPDIENYPVEAHISGFDFAQRLYEQAVGLGAEFAFERVEAIRGREGTREVITAQGAYKAQAVIIATGSRNRRLGLENEAALVGKGVSYCATCDGNFFRGRTVAVVGGGNTALEDALYLSDIAGKVYVIHRREGFRGAEGTVERLKAKPNVEWVLNSQVTRLIADPKLTAVEVTNRQDGSARVLDVNGLFVAIGRLPENEPFADLVQLDEAGYIPAGEDCRTNIPGIFAAGDNRAKAVRQLVTAAADGAVAATEAVAYVNAL